MFSLSSILFLQIHHLIFFWTGVIFPIEFKPNGVSVLNRYKIEMVQNANEIKYKVKLIRKGIPRIMIELNVNEEPGK